MFVNIFSLSFHFQPKKLKILTNNFLRKTFRKKSKLLSMDESVRLWWFNVNWKRFRVSWACERENVCRERERNKGESETVKAALLNWRRRKMMRLMWLEEVVVVEIATYFLRIYGLCHCANTLDVRFIFIYIKQIITYL